MKTFTEQDLRDREQRLTSQACFGGMLTPMGCEQSWGALREFFRDLGLHDAAELVAQLQDAFDARGLDIDP